MAEPCATVRLRSAAAGHLTTRRGHVIHWLELGPMQNLVYLLADAETHRAAVVDPAWDMARVFALAEREGLRITDALITHVHDDHVNGLGPLLEGCGARVHLARDEAEVEYWPDCPASSVEVHDDGDRIHVGALEVELVLTPGHSPGSGCYEVDDHLLTGDTLFLFGCGRCDLPGGDPRAMHDSLTRLQRRFDDGTVILPGHHYAVPVYSTFGEQRRGNPFLQFGDREAFAAFRAEHNRYRQPPYRPVPPGRPAW